MEINLLVLVLQIGFNNALNYRGHNQNPLIPSPRSLTYGQSRRLYNAPLSSRRMPTSDSEQSDSEDSSYEDYSFRALRPLPYRRGNNYMKHSYNTRAENNASLEAPLIGRLGSDNSYKSRIDYTNSKQPYLRQRSPNIKQGQYSKYQRKGGHDRSLDVSSSNVQDDTIYLRSLLSLLDLPSPRRDLTSQYHRRGDRDLSHEASPVDRFELDEDGVSSLPISRAGSSGNKLLLMQSNFGSSNYRRNNRKENKKPRSNLRHQMPSPTKDNPNTYIDTVFLLSGNGKPDNVASSRPQLRSPKQTNVDKRYNRRSYSESSSLGLSSNERLNPDDDISSNLSAFRFLKPSSLSRKLNYNSPNVLQRYNRKNNDNIGLESLLNSKLSSDDNFDSLSVLRLGNLDDLNLQSSQLRSDRNGDRSYLRLGLSPNDKLSLDEDMISSLSDLLAGILDDSSIVPVSLRSSQSLNQNNIRRVNNQLLSNHDLSAEEDALSNTSPLRLGNSDTLSVEPLLRSPDPLNRNSNQISNIKDDNNGLEVVLTDKLNPDNESAKNLVPYREFISFDLPTSTSNMETNNNRQDSDEVDIDILLNDRDDDTDNLAPALFNDNSSGDLSVLRAMNFDNASEKPSDQNNTTNKQHLEFPLNDQLSPDEGKNNNLPVLRVLNSRLRTQEQKDKRQNEDPKDYKLKVEYPWNKKLSPGDDKKKYPPGLRGLEENKEPKYYELKLEFPWNDQPSPNNDKNSYPPALSGLKEKKGSKDDELKLLFPRNDILGPEKIQDLETTSKKQDSPSRSVLDPEYEHPYLRNLKMDRNFESVEDRLESSEASLFKKKEVSQLDAKSHLGQSDKLVENQNLHVIPIGRQGSENDSGLLENSDEEPSFIPFALDRRPHLRFRKRDGIERQNTYFRRADASLSNAIVSSNATESNGISKVETHNDERVKYRFL